MTRIGLQPLLEPWRRLPQTIVFYATIGAIGAVLLTALHIALPVAKTPQPDVPVIAPQPGGDDRKTDELRATPEAISRLWEAAKKSNNTQTLQSFIAMFPNSPFVAEASARIAILRRIANMQLADAGNGIESVAHLIQNSTTNPQPINRFLATNGLADIYTVALAVFYANGNNVASYIKNTSSNFTFDLTDLRVSMNAKEVCLNQLNILSNGRSLATFRDVCFAGNSIIRFAKVGSVEIDIVPISGSPTETAWAIGLRDAE